MMSKGLLWAFFLSFGRCASVSVAKDFICCCVFDFVLVGSSLTLAAGFGSRCTLVLFAFVVGRGADRFFPLKSVPSLLLSLSLSLSSSSLSPSLPFPKSSPSESCCCFFCAFFPRRFIDVLSPVRTVLITCSAFQCPAHIPTSGRAISRKLIAWFHSFV